MTLFCGNKCQPSCLLNRKGSTEKPSCCNVLVDAGENCDLVCGLKLDQRGFLCLEGLHQLIIDVCQDSLSSCLDTK
jgi:hypothetical protein